MTSSDSVSNNVSGGGTRTHTWTTDWTQTQPSAGSSGGSTTGTTGGSTSTTGSTGTSSTGGSTSGSGSTTGTTGTSSPATVTFSGSDSGSETTDASYADVVLTAGFAGIAHARGAALGLGIADYLAPSGDEAAAGEASGDNDTSDASGSEQSQDTSEDNTAGSSSASSTSNAGSSTSQSSGLTAWLQGLYFASVGSQLYAWAHSTAETTDSPLIAALAEGVVGGLQGQANTANGLQDILIGLANSAIDSIPGAAQVRRVAARFGINTTIPSPDWSRGTYGEESDRVHWWSKFLGGNGIFIAMTLGLGELLMPAGTMSVQGSIVSARGAALGSKPHVVFRVGTGDWYHGIGNPVTIRAASSEWVSNPAWWNTLILPVRDPQAAAGFIETSVTYQVVFRNCLTAMLKTWWMGM